MQSPLPAAASAHPAAVAYGSISNAAGSEIIHGDPGTAVQNTFAVAASADRAGIAYSTAGNAASAEMELDVKDPGAATQSTLPTLGSADTAATAYGTAGSVASSEMDLGVEQPGSAVQGCLPAVASADAAAAAHAANDATVLREMTELGGPYSNANCFTWPKGTAKGDQDAAERAVDNFRKRRRIEGFNCGPYPAEPADLRRMWHPSKTRKTFSMRQYERFMCEGIPISREPVRLPGYRTAGDIRSTVLGDALRPDQSQGTNPMSNDASWQEFVNPGHNDEAGGEDDGEYDGEDYDEGHAENYRE